MICFSSSSILYCIKIIHRSPAVIDLAVGFDEHGCKESHLHYTLFRESDPSGVISRSPLRFP